ncbi:polysaccharide biosynthesis protein [Intestinibacter bartlettii]|uniref:polysaccharide biosynthesis protein n=2 Tax=Intestinibacter bartlettii TaxID=261299 RepID=UPI001D02AFF1|nr:nucleoside-diphosphate sugar epimerase/dehydratase [Intestinibacter bartlettii]MCB5746089.1 polysaccharide biosynthesis protein [Intestinibacter bartlettii]MDU1254714.1 nucleoside-diphosphate sugar epimerase/dehydratase [Peptostreptococcaceae bacterium]
MVFNLMQKIDEMSKNPDKSKMRQIILSAMDFIICVLSCIVTMFLLRMKITTLSLLSILIYAVINEVCIFKFKCYDSLWKCGGEKEVASIFTACFCAIFPAVTLAVLAKQAINPAFYIVNVMVIIVGMVSLRISYRTMRRIVMKTELRQNASDSQRVLIVGAGEAGNMIVRELFKRPELKKMPVGVVDDDKNKQGKCVYDVPVLGTIDDVEHIVKNHCIDEIIICIANINPKRKREIINICKKTDAKIKTIPGIYEIIDEKVNITKFRDVQIEDLLGREPIKMNLDDMNGIIKNKIIMVTGGGGSIGSELCRQIVKYEPKQLVLIDIYENNAYDIQQEIKRHFPEIDLKVLIASVRDEHKMDKIFEQYKPEIVFHAAAHKHVPLMEDSPCEAIKNNVFGTQNVVNLSDKYNVKKFVLISTDKAVNPTNIMGATKRCCEMIVQTKNKTSKTEFVAVRFGNVLGSNGSVVPLFKKQIEEGGPVTVTHEEVTRFFMTIPEAVSLVLQASAMAKGGEIFVLDMGEPVKIIDLARNLIKLSGFEPNVDIKIEVTGLRPGEKLYEEVLMDEEGLQKTSNNQIRIGRPIEIDKAEFKKELNILKRVADNDQDEKVDLIMKSIVPTYVRREEVVV